MNLVSQYTQATLMQRTGFSLFLFNLFYYSHSVRPSLKPFQGFIQKNRTLHCVSSLLSSQRLWFQLFLVSSSICQKIVPAMKYSAVSKWAEMATSESTQSQFFFRSKHMTGESWMFTPEHSVFLCRLVLNDLNLVLKETVCESKLYFGFSFHDKK